MDISETEMSTDVCDNVTESGEIGPNQTNAGGFIPETIESTTPASAGTETIQYVWITKLPRDIEWIMISGASSESYSHSYLSETTLFRRCAHNAGCDVFDAESNNNKIAAPYNYYELSCETGTGKLASNVSGGTTPYTYLWSVGETGQ